jgi:glycosyltransferase involved in cell wall biosynthesis
MKIAFVGGFAFNPKGTMRARAHPLAVELVKRGYGVTMFLVPYDNLADSGREWVQAGVRISNLTTGSTPLSYPGLLVGLCRAINRYQPDLIHIFKPKGFAGAAGRYFITKGSHSVVVDCDDWEGWGGWNDVKGYPWIVKEFIDRQEHWMMRNAPAITVASRSLQTRVLSVRGTSDGIYYMPNGVGSSGGTCSGLQSQSEMEIRRQFNLPQGPLIFYAGHFEPGEDATVFCRIAAPVAERNGASFVFVGDGPESHKVRDCFSERTQAKAYFFPRLPYGQFLQLVLASDVAAFPCPDDPVHRAKCSSRIIDYMSMGKPVITSNVGQNREYITDNESGMLAAAGDEVSFQEKLELLLSDPQLRLRLGQNAKQRIHQHFGWSGAPLEQCLAAYGKVTQDS